MSPIHTSFNSNSTILAQVVNLSFKELEPPPGVANGSSSFLRRDSGQTGRLKDAGLPTLPLPGHYILRFLHLADERRASCEEVMNDPGAGCLP